MAGIYIHVPFCEKRCSYCSFYSTIHGKKERDAYVNSLIAEMQHRQTEDTIQTVYLGGGTPSQLDTEELELCFEALHRIFRIAPDAEFTFEANPDDITLEKARHLVQLGINRVSLGVQSFNDTQLITINRRHTAQQARAAIDSVHEAGIKNLSIDLMFGLPQQSLEDWQWELEQAFSLDIQHLSAYALTYEEGTPLYYDRAKGKVEECDEDTSLAMFRFLSDRAQIAGFEQYEIANFAKPGFRSRHNSNYWQGIPYLGFGPGAHSYDGHSTRRFNEHKLRAYNAASTLKAPFADVPHQIETLTTDERYDEMILTRLRTREGINLEELDDKRKSYLLGTAQPFLERELLIITSDQRLQLTHAGIFVSDDIMSELMWP
jgi:putative coproporphyrinogen dehydrogenase